MNSVRSKRRWVLILGIFLQVASVWSVTAVASASSSTEVITIPASLGFDPETLAAIEACAGEAVTFIGDAVLVVHRTTLADGSWQLVIHSNPQGVVGLGVSSGTTYRLVADDTLARIVAPSGGFVSTFTANVWVIRQGGHPRFGGPILLHITVTPTGDVTADIKMLDKGFQCLS